MEPRLFSERITAGIYLLLALLSFFLLLIYAATGQIWLLFLMVIPLLVAVAAYLLGNVSGMEEQRRRIQATLSDLAMDLLELVDDRPGQHDTLARYLPTIFPDCRVILWADADRLLFPADNEQQLPLAVMNARLAVEPAGHLNWAVNKQEPAGLLVGFPDWPGGGLYVVPGPNTDPTWYLSPAQQVAAGMSRLLLRDQKLANELAEQAESYEAAIFSEAYRAEMLAQTLTLRRMEEELDVAWQIQASLLPADTPDLAGWQLVAELEPARQMSGDFYDFIPLPGGRLGLVVADVADKGLGPALYMALCRTLIRSYAEVHPTRPEQVLAAANRRILNETTSDLFVTVFYAILDPRTGRMHYCNAGHNPPLLFRAGDEKHPFRVEALTRTSLPLGILEDIEASHAIQEIQLGDLLVLYTDGITEAMDEGEDFFGEQRLLEFVAQYHHQPAQIVGEKLVAAVYEFMGDAPQQDDITLVMVSRDLV